MSTQAVPQGVFICCIGMGLLVFSDQTQNSAGGPGQSAVAGDLLMLAGATLYGFSESRMTLSSLDFLTYSIANATEEFFVRNAPLYQVCTLTYDPGSTIYGESDQVVGQLGMWGMIINGIQVGYSSCPR
jgi:solute carrier family 35, member F1/2